MKKSSASEDHVAPLATTDAMEHQSSSAVIATPHTASTSDLAHAESEASATRTLADSLRALAADVNLAILLVEGAQLPQLLIENNNSVCAQMQSSPASAARCVPYCGEAHTRAVEAGGTLSYKCHAGLECCATKIKTDTDDARKLVAITGRAFLHTEDFRNFVNRVEHREYPDLDRDALFQNVIFTTREKLFYFAERVNRGANAPAFKQAVQELTGCKSSHTIKTRQHSAASSDLTTTDNRNYAVNEIEDAGKPHGKQNKVEAEVSPTMKELNAYEAASHGVELPDVVTFPRDFSSRDACALVLELLAAHAGLKSAAVALRSNGVFRTLASGGRLASAKALDLESLLKDDATAEAVRRSMWLTLPAHDIAVSNGRRRAKESSVEKRTTAATLTLFALNIGDELKGVLALDTESLNERERRELVRFARAVAMPLEVLRLREELEQRLRAAYHLQTISGSINAAKPEETYQTILKHSAELLHAERGSLLLFDEDSRELSVKAALGPRAEVAQDERLNIGEGVSGNVIRNGRPLVVSNVRHVASAYAPAPAERNYKSDSFISFPIMDKARPVAVLNVTDKLGGGIYDEADLRLIEMIAPQISIALDRAAWHQKATLFQMLSITDPLTGLLNRRYLEERMSEEIERSRRHRYQMSFMMIDIDDFKLYNDLNGHQAGDVALELTAQTLKSALRAVDVAARYGGEELCVLLPQTNLIEAEIIGERIRRRVERTQYRFGAKQPLGALTVSLGISMCSDELDTPKAIIEAADRALYLAKHDGKNCVRTQQATVANITPSISTGYTTSTVSKKRNDSTINEDDVGKTHGEK